MGRGWREGPADCALIFPLKYASMIQNKALVLNVKSCALQVIEVSLQALCSSCVSASSFRSAVCHIFTFCMLSFLTFKLFDI